ncbi:MAG: adenylosuccinate lyase [Deltaproteobacteria bacterium]|nr:adenylosuccinate lyase [Deltaproteobacteria bacterium]MCL5276863.1 adenylosuccinate lyase [Deltaproteobacteria bacterium]
MIDRYSRKQCADIWTNETKYRIWLDVELAACEAYAKAGKIPKASLERIMAKADFDAGRVDEIELVVKHDVIALLTAVKEKIGEDARFIHMGLTSSDVLDTAFAVQLVRAGRLILDDVDRLLKVLREKAFKYKSLPTIGRTHGIHAEPIVFGLKFVSWYEEMRRNRGRLERAVENVRYGKIKGAVGTYGNIDPAIEQYVCKKLGLNVEPYSTQVIARDRHAEYFSDLAILAAGIERIALEIRHLQRTEVREAEEYFTEGQKGSSAMPHKRNPILSENLTGLSRVVRSYLVSALENIPLWHERDISHSSVERIIAPDATILVDFMLNRAIWLVDRLVVHEDRLLANLDMTRGLYDSEKVMLSLIDKGMAREEAYAIIQKAAFTAFDRGQDFADVLSENRSVSSLIKKSGLRQMLGIESHLRYVDYIYKQVFGQRRPSRTT